MTERTYYLTPINPFTPRQAQITELIANGLQVKEVGSKLGISHRTVETIIHGSTETQMEQWVSMELSEN